MKPSIRVFWRWLVVGGLLLVTGVGVAQQRASSQRWTETPLKSLENADVYISTPAGRTGCNFTSFSIYWDIPTDQDITEEQEKRLLDEHIVPAMKSKCPNLIQWTLYHFIKGKPLLDENGKEIAFSGLTYGRFQGRWVSSTATATARARWAWRSYDKAQAGLAEAQRAIEESQRAGEQARKRREEEEKKRRETKCAAESVGGTEPCGLELARAYVRAANLLMPHCPSLLQHEWCSINLGQTWVQWVGGTKHSCSAVKGEQALLCEFSADWNCKVRNMRTNEEVTSPAVVGLYCAAFRPAKFKAKAIRRGGDWEIQLLRDGSETR